MVDIGHIASRVQSPLTNLVTSSGTDFSVVSTSGFVAPCAVLVGHKDAWHDPAQSYVPELVWITTVVDGTTLRCVLSDRGISGTAVRSHDGTAGDLVVTQVLDQRNWIRLRDELAAKLALAGGTLTGDLIFDTLLDASNRLIDLQQGYGLWSDNVGPGTDGTRMWVNAPEGGAVFVGPRAGSSYLDELQLRTRAIKQVSPDGVADVAKIVRGTYTGDGTAPRTIDLPFAPGFVVISWNSGGIYYTAQSGAQHGASVAGLYMESQSGSNTVGAVREIHLRPELGSTHFIVGGITAAAQLNFSGVTYTYYATGV